MLQKILSLLTAFIFLTTAIPADSRNKVFLAVYANPGVKSMGYWNKYNPNLFVTSTNWNELDEFLSRAKQKAGDNDLVLDIEVHGSPVVGTLHLAYHAFGDPYDNEANVGYLLTHIESYFHNKKNLTVCLEACYSSVCTSMTTHSKAFIESEEYHVVNYTGDKPIYPIYGEGDCSNYNNLVYLQYKYGIHEYFVDLRDYMDNTEPVKPDYSAEKELALQSLCALLETYGN